MISMEMSEADFSDAMHRAGFVWSNEKKDWFVVVGQHRVRIRSEKPTLFDRLIDFRAQISRVRSWYGVTA